MKINNINYVPRNGKATTLQRVGLEVYFINEGNYVDPYEISSVTIFKTISNQTPSTILDASTNLVSATPLMGFANSAATTSDTSFDASNYTIGGSGIHKLGTGRYIVLLDGTVSQSGAYNGSEIESGTSAIGDYIDVWTVTFVEASLPQVIINYFKLVQDTFIALSEPVIFTPRVRLVNKNVKFGSIIDLKFTVDFTVENRNIPIEVLNLFNSTIINNPKVQIQKVNSDVNTFSPLVTVSSFADTSSSIQVTSDNTMIFNWNTNQITSHPTFTSGLFGPIKGHYQVQVEYSVLNQTLRTEQFNLMLS